MIKRILFIALTLMISIINMIIVCIGIMKKLYLEVIILLKKLIKYGFT